MSKEGKTNRIKEFFKRINKKIGSFSNAGLAIIIATYMVLLVVIIILVIPSHNYTVIPGYEHQTTYNDIEPRFQIVSRRTASDSEIKQTYYTRAVVASRTSKELSSDASLSILKYQMQALTTKDEIYYFSESTNKTTSWGYSSTLSESNEPAALFANIKYVNADGVTSWASFKEEMMLDLVGKEAYGSANVLKINEDVRFTLQAISTTDGSDSLVSMRIVSSTSSFFHIDMQSWIETASGESMTFIGVYNHTKDTWSVASERILNKINAKTLYFKLVCYYEGAQYNLLYKINVKDMPTSYSSISDEVNEPVEKNNTWALYVGVGASVIAVGCAVMVIIVAKKKSNQKKELENGQEIKKE